MSAASALIEPTTSLLGVECSVTGRRWAERCAGLESDRAIARMVQAHGLPELLARVLTGRGVAPDAAEAYLAPRLRDLMPDPDSLLDMQAAVRRLAQAVREGETIAVFGDYDVDGAASAAMLAEYLRGFGLTVPVHIPDRIAEGYGPNEGAIAALAAEGARVLVCVDCGTSGHGPLEQAARNGLDVIVLDHHAASEILPQVHAVVNPNRQDDLSGLGHLCAAGVVFLTLVALNRHLRIEGFFGPERPEPRLTDSLDLVALATVADVVPLRDLNRAFVVQGLSVMRHRGRTGLAALLDASSLSEPPEAWHLGFVLGPRINAGGRIGDAALGARLLSTRDPVEAARIAVDLDRLNRERQAIEAQAVAEAEAAMDRALTENPALPVLVMGNPDWHPGIVGLVAARLKERFGRPAFAFAIRPDGSATGSGRSVPGVDLGQAVRACVEAGKARKGGGHAMAAGVTLDGDAIAAFEAHLAFNLGAAVEKARAADALLIDGTLSAGGATAETVRLLQRAGPFGQGAPEPLFALARHRIVDAGIVGTGHVRARLRSRDGQAVGAICFRAAERPLGRAILGSVGREVHAVGTLSRDQWRGADRAQLRIVDLALAD